MGKMLANITYLFPVMAYYLLEAIIVGAVIALMWRLFLVSHAGHLGYVPIVVIYWIVKMLLFDIFKLIGNAQPQQNPNYNPNNENVTP